MTTPIEALEAELREQAEYLSKRAWDRGCQDSGIGANLAERAADALASQAATIRQMREALESIRDFPKPGTSRRTEDGYPDEIVYDEFAYRRIVDSYRECARAALNGGAK